MPILAISVVAVLLATVATARGQEASPSTRLQTEYLMSLDIPLDPVSQPVGHRLIVNVPAGGTVRGPKVRGNAVLPAGDWLYIMPDGSLRLDARLTIRTDDDQLVFVEYGGVIVWSKEVLDRFNKGEVISENDGYFVIVPRFTTASAKYAWLNQIQAVGKMVTMQKNRIRYDIFTTR